MEKSWSCISFVEVMQLMSGVDPIVDSANSTG